MLFIFVPKCSCQVNILQHTVDDVKMPKTNFLHTAYISKKITWIMSCVLLLAFENQNGGKKANPISLFRASRRWLARYFSVRCTHSRTSKSVLHPLSRTLVKSSRIYTGQYTFPILLLNDDNMLAEHK